MTDDTPGMNNPATVWPALDEAADPNTTMAARLRALCQTDDHPGGGAAYVHLAADEPTDDEGSAHLQPLLSVPVADVLRIVDEAHVPASDPGIRKPISGKLTNLLQQIIRSGRKSAINARALYRPARQYPTLASLEAACRSGEAYGLGPVDRRNYLANVMWRNTRPYPSVLMAGGAPAVEAAVLKELTRRGRYITVEELLTPLTKLFSHRAGSGPLDRREVTAALGVLVATGQATVRASAENRPLWFRAVDPPTGRPDRDHAARIALAVVLGDYLDQRPDGAMRTELLDYAKTNTRLAPGRAPSPSDLSDALYHMALLHLVTITSASSGRYFALRHAPEHALYPTTPERTP